jgi:KaiC/GvpD/RAD55 family RecA-like ATPase
MGVPIDVPGLSAILPEVEDGRVVVIDAAGDPAKSFFVRRLTLSALRSGHAATFVTTRDRSEVRSLLGVEGGLLPWNESEVDIVEEEGVGSLEALGRKGGLLAVDSFSFLALGAPGLEVAKILRDLRAACREQHTTVILGTDRGMFEPQTEAIVSHLADGVIQFHATEGPEGLVRFLRIPKWSNGKIVDRNVHYEFDGNRIAVDLRKRVL